MLKLTTVNVDIFAVFAFIIYPRKYVHSENNFYNATWRQHDEVVVETSRYLFELPLGIHGANMF